MLHMDNNAITGAGLIQLAKLPRLQLLSVKDCNLSPKDIAKFKALRPDVQVLYLSDH